MQSRERIRVDPLSLSDPDSPQFISLQHGLDIASAAAEYLDVPQLKLSIDLTNSQTSIPEMEHAVETRDWFGFGLGMTAIGGTVVSGVAGALAKSTVVEVGNLMLRIQPTSWDTPYFVTLPRWKNPLGDILESFSEFSGDVANIATMGLGIYKEVKAAMAHDIPNEETGAFWVTVGGAMLVMPVVGFFMGPLSVLSFSAPTGDYTISPPAVSCLNYTPSNYTPSDSPP